MAGVILSVGRALAESAALIFTSGYVDRMPESVGDSGRALSIHIYDLAMNVPGGDGQAYASALTLIAFLLLINGGVTWLGRSEELSKERMAMIPDQEPQNSVRSWHGLEDTPPCCSPEPLICAEKLTLHYGSNTAFEGISWSIHKGCLTAIVGPSGCGKTSFLSCINRLTDLIPQSQISGSLTLGETDILSSSTNILNLRRRVGMIFQQPAPFPLSIRKKF